MLVPGFKSMTFQLESSFLSITILAGICNSFIYRLIPKIFSPCGPNSGYFNHLCSHQQHFQSLLFNRHCTTTIALWRFLLERLMTAQAFENVNIYILFSKTRYLKPAATRHQLRGSIVYWQIIAVLSFIFKSAI